MKFVSIRDFRNQTAAIRKALSTEHEIVLTASGRPVALLADVDEESFEEKLAALRRTRDYALLDRVRARARETGVDQLTLEQIDAEIAKARRERRAGK